MCLLPLKAELEESGEIFGVPSEEIYLGAMIAGAAQEPIR